MWSWISGGFPCSNKEGFECDSMQSVPRELVYSPRLQTLLVNPIQEVDQLRTAMLVPRLELNLSSTAPVVVTQAAGDTLDLLVNFTCATLATDSAMCGASLQVRASSDGVEGLILAFQCGQHGCGVKVNSTVSRLQASSAAARPLWEGVEAKPTFPVPYAPGEVFDGRFQIRVLVDTCVAEVYAQGGRAAYSKMHVPSDPSHNGVRLKALQGSVAVSATFQAHRMGSAYAS